MTMVILVQLDVRKSGQEIIDVICKTFTLGHSDDYYLSLPKTRKRERTKVLIPFMILMCLCIVDLFYSQIVKATLKECEGHDSHHSSKFCVQLDKPLKDQFDFSVKPYLLHLR